MDKKSIVKKWLGYAQDDLRAAQILYKEKAYRACVYHCHQALEKIFKAVILAKGKAFHKIHDLVELYEDSNVSLPENIITFLSDLNPHYLLSKYPDIEYKLRYSRKRANSILETTGEIFKWLKLELS